MSALVARGQNVFYILRPKFSTQVISFNLRCQCRHKHGTLCATHFDKVSDSYITIVPTHVTKEQVGQLSKRTIDWLTEKEIVSNKLTDCVLGQHGGHAPGKKYMDIIDGNDFGLLGLRTNGLEIVTERQVFDNRQNGLEEINCPNCGANNIDSGWRETIGSWDNEEDAELKCVHCDKESSIVDYDFKPSWGFGEFGLIFWNWPTLKSEFLDNLKKIIGGEVRVIYGRL